MKIALYSDLHLEKTHNASWIPAALDVDVVILAGDIGRNNSGLNWATTLREQASVRPEILYVAGNHEYHGTRLGAFDALRKPANPMPGVHFLEMDTFELPGVRFLGCTLWSGFEISNGDVDANGMNNARFRIDDYQRIAKRSGERLEPHDTLALHQKAVNWLDVQLSRPYSGRTVVVTHFAPHRKCSVKAGSGHDSCYAVTDLSRLMEKHRIDLWCHGHTHTNNDFIAENGCRVIANQRGYPKEVADGRMGFRNDLVIELEDSRI